MPEVADSDTDVFTYPAASIKLWLMGYVPDGTSLHSPVSDYPIQVSFTSQIPQLSLDLGGATRKCRLYCAVGKLKSGIRSAILRNTPQISQRDSAV